MRIGLKLLIVMLIISLGLNLYLLNNKLNIRQAYALNTKTYNISYPKFHINSDRIRVFNNSVVLSLSNVDWSRVENTSSMLPLLRYNSFILEKKIDYKALKKGDIITFYYPKCRCKVVHRIVDIGYDNEGWYAITKGDNNNYTDGKIRKDQVLGVVFGIIY